MQKTSVVSAKNCFMVLSDIFYVQKRCQNIFQPFFLEKYFFDPSPRKKTGKKTEKIVKMAIF